ncbi:dipeptidyl-peptidase 7. Serine peptidase. MEROPS family S46 [Fontimonas thermophila]|uniref:Dipeptidyl-peptidase n=1 Tax=Fontimonas thermophila TaxID=1076937 RepID=A0A1I2J7N0_9GAMM|nr:S46 family peptidase [Fontimonas thermophila]SFF50802.1 dipeptidyl-peptidase 7. Serine peptidase. MEROPS family S46 [Fontimonas thermophila]
MKQACVFLLLAVVAGPLSAAEGMWTLDNLPRAALKERYDFTPDAQWVDHVMKASVRLASGCSGSFVSANGLVLTNAHCVLDCVQALSGPQSDYVNRGFIAHRREAERQCPSEELNQLEAISDVTERVRKATAGLSGQAFIDARNAETARIESECVGAAAATRRCDVVELYGGGLYHLYRYRRYADVRLVFAPEYRIGFFGGDPDNFNFPRYNLDMGLLRVYEDGKPATTPQFFPIRREGAAVGELVMVTGHPGNTKRQLTVAQLERLRDADLIDLLAYYSERRALLWQYGRQSAEAARQAQSDLTYTENSLKVIRGQLDALLEPALLAHKRMEEERLRQIAGALQPDPWAAIAQAQQVYRTLRRPYTLLENRRGFYSEHFRIARHLVRAAEERTKPNHERLPEYQDAALPRLQQTLLSPEPIYPAYEKTKLAWSLTKLREQLGVDDPLVKLVLGNESPEVLAAKLVDGTRLSDPAERRRLWEGGFEAISASTDPFIQLARAIDAPSRELRKRYESEVEAVENKQAATIARVRFAHDGMQVYPDATFTLRLSYGEVRGWQEDGRTIPPFTTFAGLFQRATGTDPFALPESWLKAQTRLDGQTPFNFVTTNDIIGGNSGSPIIDRAGRIVGLAFDGNIHSLGGSFWYDEARNRCVGVHSAAMIEALDKVYGAKALLRELVVQP